MKLEKYRHTLIFYGVAVIVPWALWFTAGAISKSPLWEDQSWMTFASILVILGSVAPMAVAFALILPDKEMRDELISACINFRGIHWKWWAFHLLCNFSNEIFFTHPDVKIIQTLLFIIFAAAVVLKDKEYFFNKAYEQGSGK